MSQRDLAAASRMQVVSTSAEDTVLEWQAPHRASMAIYWYRLSLGSGWRWALVESGALGTHLDEPGDP